MRFTSGKDVDVVRPGGTLVIPGGRPHSWGPDGDAGARVRVVFTPPASTAHFFDTYFALAREGKVNAKGLANPVRMAQMAGPTTSTWRRSLSPFSDPSSRRWMPSAASWATRGCRLERRSRRQASIRNTSQARDVVEKAPGHRRYTLDCEEPGNPSCCCRMPDAGCRMPDQDSVRSWAYRATPSVTRPAPPRRTG